MNTDLHNTVIENNASDDRSRVLYAYISERQPFYIRWGMFAVAAMILLVSIASLLIKVPAETMLHAKFTLPAPPSTGQPAAATLIFPDHDTRLCQLKPGDKIELSLYSNPHGDRVNYHSSIGRISCDSITIVRLSHDTAAGASAFLHQWQLKPDEPVQVRFQTGHVSLFYYLYNM